MKGRDGRTARAKELWRIPKAPPTMPASIRAVYNIVEGKSFGASRFVLLTARPSKIRPQIIPTMMARIEPTREVMVIPS